MVTVKVPWEPELLDPWKATWDGLIWKAMIPKVKAIAGEPNRNPRSFQAGRSQLFLLLNLSPNSIHGFSISR
jgi:hypothetical protein